MSENTTPAAVANLRDTKKQLAQAKQRHPAGKAAPAKVAAKEAPAKAAAKSPVKAPATEKAPRKAPTQSGRQKLRWSKVDGGGLIAVTDEATYSILPSNGKFVATAKKGNKTETILDGVSEGRAYQALNRLHHYNERPANKKASA
jgi:hypothetical protein